MIPSLRKEFNNNFTIEKYESFLNEIHNVYPGAIEFRIAETAVFVPKDFTKNSGCLREQLLISLLIQQFKALTKNAIPKGLEVPGENDHSHFIAFDFGVCVNDAGELEPQLVEMQGFPSLFWHMKF